MLIEMHMYTCARAMENLLFNDLSIHVVKERGEKWPLWLCWAITIFLINATKIEKKKKKSLVVTTTTAIANDDEFCIQVSYINTWFAQKIR